MDSVILQLILSFILGGLIGFEREINEKKIVTDIHRKPTALLGIRTFSLISGLGALAGILYKDFPPLSLVVCITTCAYLAILYILDSLKTKEPGITTEVALFYSFIIGLLITLNILPVQIILALSILIIVLLSKKNAIKKFAGSVNESEINSFISYSVIALVILPFLPNITYSLNDLTQLKPVLAGFGLPEKISNIEFFNPFKLWMIVTLITGVDMVGYILERTLGQKNGWILASIAGGFISSTATTQTLAQQSKKSGSVNYLISSAILSNMTSFIQIAILIGSINSIFLARAAPVLLITIISAGIMAWYFLIDSNKYDRTQVSIKTHEMFALTPALKFTFLFLVISLISKVSLFVLGETGLFVTSAFGALVGLDAVMINTASLAGNMISYQTGVAVFILVNTVNLGAKSLYCFLQGKKEFAVKFTLSMIFVIITSLLGLLLI